MKKLLLLALAALPHFVAAQLPSYVPSNGLVGWWPFSGNAIDSSGNGHNGTVQGATLVADRYAMPNKAYDFITDTITLANPAAFNANQFTISAWICTTSPNTSTVFSKFDGQQLFIFSGYLFGISQNHASLWVSNNNAGVQVTGTSIVTDGTWHFISATFDGATARLYVDGVLENSGSATLSLPTCPAYIGFNALGGAMQGKLDDIGFWNRALTLPEIIALYQYPIIPPTVCLKDTIGLDNINYETSVFTNMTNFFYYANSVNSSILKLGQTFQTNSYLNWNQGNLTLQGITFFANNIVQVGSANLVNVEVRKLNGSSYCSTCSTSNNMLDSIPNSLIYSISVPTNAINFSSTSGLAGINFPVNVSIPPGCDFAVIMDFTQLGDDTISHVYGEDLTLGYTTAIVIESGASSCPTWQPMDNLFCNTWFVNTRTTIGLNIVNQPIVQAQSICPGDTAHMTLTWNGTAYGLPEPYGGSYAWSPNAINSTASSAEYTPSSSQSVTYTYTSACNETVTAASNLTVLPCIPQVNFQASDTTICVGECINFIDYSSYSPNTWSWSFPGAATTSSNQQNPTNICYPTAGTYPVTLTVSNGNGNGSLTKTAYIVVNPSPGVNAGSDIFLCNGNSATLSPQIQNTYSGLQWNGTNISNASTLSPTISPSASGWYSLTAYNILGCSDTDSLFVTVTNPVYQPLCLVTTDSLTGNFNVLVWEKPSQYAFLDSFIVYREITLNNYQRIGAVHADSLSTFSDLTANPNSTSYRYKLTSKDTCGTESIISDYHRTIHLQYLGTGNFQWSFYEIENLTNQVASYNFYRDDLGNGNFQLLQVIPGANNTFTDVNYSVFPNARYRVDVNWLNNVSCSPSRSIVSSYSNIYGLNPNGIQESNSYSFSVTQNPTQDNVFITCSNSDMKIFTLTDAEGRAVRTYNVTGTQAQLSLEGLASGVYFLSGDGEEKAVQRIIKQ